MIGVIGVDGADADLLVPFTARHNILIIVISVSYIQIRYNNLDATGTRARTYRSLLGHVTELAWRGIE